MSKKTTEAEKDLPKMKADLTLDDILNSTDDGSYGKPLDEYEVKFDDE